MMMNRVQQGPSEEAHSAQKCKVRGPGPSHGGWGCGVLCGALSGKGRTAPGASAGDPAGTEASSLVAPLPLHPDPHTLPSCLNPACGSQPRAGAVSWPVPPLARLGCRGAWLDTVAGGGRELAPEPHGKLSLAPATFQLFTSQLVLISFLQSPQYQFSHVSAR